MNLKKINRLFPFQNLLKILILFSFIFQFFTISYNHLSGYYHVENFIDFLIRLGYSSFFTIIASFLTAYPDLFLIYFLNQKLTWNKQAFKRVLLQLLLTISIAIIISILITLIVHAIDRYDNDIFSVLITNALIFIVVNIVMITILEAWIFFNESKQARIKAEELEQELSQIKFEVLKSQINPHFLFNSLNVLSGLISKDKNKAQEFIDEFSFVYRYVLESIEKQVVKLENELEFVKSYMFLQQLRYGEHLVFSSKIDSEYLSKYLPPLSLQTVLENAMKHNEIGGSKKLEIEISIVSGLLQVKNNIQSKISKPFSTGMGQINLKKRYAMISESSPVFYSDTKYYIVTLPLIESE